MLSLAILAPLSWPPDPPSLPPRPPPALPTCTGGAFEVTNEEDLRSALAMSQACTGIVITVPAATTVKVSKPLRFVWNNGDNSSRAAFSAGDSSNRTAFGDDIADYHPYPNSSYPWHNISTSGGSDDANFRWMVREWPNVTIVGAGENATLDAQGLSGVLEAAFVRLTVRRLRLVNGNGSCVFLYHSLASFEDVTVEGCRAYSQGGGFDIQKTVVAFDHVRIRDCHAGIAGGGISMLGTEDFRGSLVARHLTISDCSAGNGSLGWYEDGLHVHGSLGGGLYGVMSAVSLEDSEVADSAARGTLYAQGGCIFLESTPTRLRSVSVARCTTSSSSHDGLSGTTTPLAMGCLTLVSRAGSHAAIKQWRESANFGYGLSFPPFVDLEEAFNTTAFQHPSSDIGDWHATDTPWLADILNVTVSECVTNAEKGIGYGGGITYWDTSDGSDYAPLDGFGRLTEVPPLSVRLTQLEVVGTSSAGSRAYGGGILLVTHSLVHVVQARIENSTATAVWDTGTHPGLLNTAMAQGGGLCSYLAYVAIYDSTIEHCEVVASLPVTGSSSAEGGGLALVDSNVRLRTTNVSSCIARQKGEGDGATAKGGGVYKPNGFALFEEQVLLSSSQVIVGGTSTKRRGHQLYFEGLVGDLIWTLPTMRGHWLPVRRTRRLRGSS